MTSGPVKALLPVARRNLGRPWEKFGGGPFRQPSLFNGGGGDAPDAEHGDQ